MFDARYFAYATISALLVISPGATMAVVLETVVGEGRLAALFTVLGINIGNSTLALASALGMSVVFHAWPATLQAVKIGGAGYLTYLGLRGLWFAWRGRDDTGRKPGAATGGTGDTRPKPHAATGGTGDTGPKPRAATGGTRDTVVPAFARLRRVRRRGSETDVREGGKPRAAGWVGRGVMTNLLNPPVVLFYMTFLPQFIGPQDPFFARFLLLAATHVGMSLVWLSFYAFTLGVLADRFARPVVRRTLEGITGIVLVGFGVRLLVR